MSNKKIEISYKTIVFTVLFLIGLFVLWQVRALIILMFISFILFTEKSHGTFNVTQAK